MVKEFDFNLDPEIYSDPISLKKSIAKSIFVKEEDITGIKIEKRSIDARSRKAQFQIRGKVYLGENPPAETRLDPFPKVHQKPPVIIIGTGPAGLFAALRLIQLGFKPILLERGKEVRERRRDLAILNRNGILNPESNYCFGEGGAGTYSDGKLYTRSGKRGSIETILNLFICFGADPDILVDARPHIGTNRLPEIITKIREEILNCGGEFHFGQKLTQINYAFGAVKGVQTNGSLNWNAENVILATGHSAQDVYYLLNHSKIRIEPKAFALGIRIEHPQHLIDEIQYHSKERSGFLPPAYYQLKEQINGRGAFSFCMCPGGIIAPCSTDLDSVVVNGWSPSKRNNPYSNSGMVVQVELEDIRHDGDPENPFIALEFQRSIERLAFDLGGGAQKAPAQRLVDFVEGVHSIDLPKCSYLPGLKSVNFKDLLPDFILSRLQQAFPIFGTKMKGYYTNEAIVVGVESRTSSPVRIPRDALTNQHPDLKGLYPCGEGGGYAGGILSAAMDGFKTAESLASVNSNSFI